uniref:Major facilitator superfamily (MFS) profile domain-containing protein n=1 Tax=Timema douglasi TaxID=61478 RepID=A0A7R8ZF12_TIMDO|nr:unnamed protein product [Timema douglasi]
MCGIICSSHFWGYLADTRGRKKIIITGMVMDSFITIISSFSHAYWIFVVFKFFNGFANHNQRRYYTVLTPRVEQTYISTVDLRFEAMDPLDRRKWQG